MSHKDDREVRVELLLEEFRQAWQHSRHLEIARLWYLGFFFTVLAGSLSWAARGGLALDDPRMGFRVVAMFSLLFALEALGILIYASVCKTGMALSHYVRVRRVVREFLYDHYFDEYDAMLNIFYERSGVPVGFLGSQWTTEYIVLMISVALNAALFVGARLLPNFEGMGTRDVWFVRIVASVLAVMLALTFIWAERAKLAARHGRTDGGAVPAERPN